MKVNEISAHNLMPAGPTPVTLSSHESAVTKISLCPRKSTWKLLSGPGVSAWLWPLPPPGQLAPFQAPVAKLGSPLVLNPEQQEVPGLEHPLSFVA